MITLSSGETDNTIDAGYYELAALGDFVWEDTNANGIQDGGEPGIDGVTVNLMDAAMNVIGTTVTAGGGAYSFTGLTPGDYLVQFVTPAGYVQTTQDVPNDGTNQDGNIDSDAGALGKTALITLSSGETDNTIDAGYILPAEPDVDIEKFTRVDVNPIDIEKLVRVQAPAIHGDVCDTLGKPVSLTFQNIPSTDFNPLQPSGKAGVLVNNGLDDDGSSYVVVAKNSDPNNFGTIFFQGDVSENDLFTASGAFGANTYFFFFDEQGGPLLQEFHYHTSCSAPIIVGAQPLSATLVGYDDGTPGGIVGAPDFGPGVDDDDADTPTGPEANPGDTVVFTFVVTNPIEGTEISNVVVTDQLLSPIEEALPDPTPVEDGGFNVGDTDMDDRLDFGETWLYTSTVDITDATTHAQYIDKATVVGTTSDGPVMDMDPAHFVVLATPSVDGDVCEVLGKPSELTFEYAPSIELITEQPVPGKAEILVNVGIDDDETSFVIVSSESSNPSLASAFFSGTVSFGETFVAAGGFGSNTYIYFYDDQGGTLLQQAKYHTSCSAPINLGDQVLSAKLIGFTSEGGEGGGAGSVVLPPPPAPPVDPPDFDFDGLMPGQVDIPFNPADIGEDADTPTGPIAQLDNRIVHTYKVTNTGTVDLNITDLVDDNETPTDPTDDVDLLTGPVLVDDGSGNFFNYGDTDQNGEFDPGEMWYFQASTIATVPGQHTDKAMVTAKDTGGTTVDDMDPSNYLVNPIEFEKYVFVPTEISGEGDLCDIHGKVVALTFEYIPGTTVTTAQASGKADILFQGAEDDDGTSFIIVTDESNAASALAGSGKRFFEGEVDFNDLFEANEDTDEFKATTYIHFFDSSDGSDVGDLGLLQTVVYHTSCSQPIQLLDEIGNATLVEYDGESGSASDTVDSGLGVPADSPPGAFVVKGDEIVFNLVVTNSSTGPYEIDLTDVVVTDDGVELTLTECVGDNCVDDILGPGETWIFTISETADTNGEHMNLGAVTAKTPSGVEIGAEDPAYYFVESLKFHVVDNKADSDFRYTKSGKGESGSGLKNGNSDPRGVASNPTGNLIWVVDKDKHVYVYDYQGTNFIGEWKAKGISKNKVQGIATDGEDIWIVDDDKGGDKVVFYDFAGNGASTLFDQEHDKTSTFDLHKDNDHSKGITSDGVHLWVVDDQKGSNDKVYKYTVDGTFVSSWSLDSANKKPRGITIDPTGASDTIWVVDADAKKVFTYDDAKKDAGGTLSATFNLAAGNTKPEGIADPDANFKAAPRESAEMGQGELTELHVGLFDSPVATYFRFDLPAVGNLSNRLHLSGHDDALRELDHGRDQQPVLDLPLKSAAIDVVFSLEDEDDTFDSPVEEDLLLGKGANLQFDVLSGMFRGCLD